MSTFNPVLKSLWLSLAIMCGFPHIVCTQTNIGLEKKVEDYLAANKPNEQYDALAGLMEYNAKVTLEEAAHYFQLYSSQQLSEKDSRFPLLAHFISADVLYYSERPDSALFHYLNLASLAKVEEDNMLTASGLGNASYVLSDLGDNLAAINLLKQNLQYSRNTGDVRDYADHTFAIANSYMELDAQDSAFHYFEETIDVDRKAGNKGGMLYNIIVLLSQYLAAEEGEKSLLLCEECLLLAQELGEARAEAQCHARKAEALYVLHRYKTAEASILSAIRVDEERRDETRMCDHYRIYGLIKGATEEWSRATELFKNSILIGKKQGAAEDLIQVYLSYGKVLREQRNYEQAVEWTSEAADLVEKNDLKGYELEVLRTMVEIYESSGDASKAYEYERKVNGALSTRLQQNSLLVTERSKNSYDLFNLENINRTLTAEKELAVAKVRRRNILLLSSGVILLLLGISAFLIYQFQLQRSRLLAQNLEFQVVEKELLALRAQMNPHFLFNSLNSINDYIMHEEPRLASRYLTKFSALMRTILNNSKERLITLEQELSALSLYVEMENLRFTDAFQYQVSVDNSISPAEVKLPSMLLQPYVENAIKHGLRNGSGGGLLRLDVGRDGETLRFVVYDNGIGRKEALKLKSRKDGERKSHGMEITSDRIKAINKIYKMNARITVVDHTTPTGTSVIIELNSL